MKDYISQNVLVEFLEYNYYLSVIDYIRKKVKDRKVNGKDIYVSSSHKDPHLSYKTPALSIEIMYRRNRNIGYQNYLGNYNVNGDSIDVEGVLFEYRVQLNVYSNTRGENYKWCSILDELLKEGEDGIPLNIYNDDGTIKKDNVTTIKYLYAEDVRNNTMPPNIVTYDYHTIYEWKNTVVQEYNYVYGLIKDNTVDGDLNNGH